LLELIESVDFAEILNGKVAAQMFFYQWKVFFGEFAHGVCFMRTNLVTGYAACNMHLTGGKPF
jgi:hypothetical protein